MQYGFKMHKWDLAGEYNFEADMSDGWWTKIRFAAQEMKKTKVSTGFRGCFEAGRRIVKPKSLYRNELAFPPRYFLHLNSFYTYFGRQTNRAVQSM